ncbi:small heat shock protein [Cytidiella melzeri]|nr:small heat shock protein [Cytidiella melzeri]
MAFNSFFIQPAYNSPDFDHNGLGHAQRPAHGTQMSRGSSSETNSTLMRPRIDVHEDAKTNTVTTTFELPGLSKQDVHIEVHNNVLSVSGESKISADRSEEGYAVRERRYGRFSRAVPIPQGIKTEDIKASMENGVLTVTFPLTTPEQAPQKITIA